MTRFLFALLVIGSVLILPGCSETGKPKPEDPSGPQVRLFYPPAGRDIADSVDVYVVRKDQGADQSEGTVRNVQFYFARPEHVRSGHDRDRQRTDRN